MRRILLVGALLPALAAGAQRHEIGLTLGRVSGQSKSAPGGPLDLGSGMALQANYALRLAAWRAAEVWSEVHFLASPLREIESINRTVTRDFASLYVTPGVRLKFAPGARVSPLAAIGGGYALLEQSVNRLDGTPNGAPRFIHRGVLTFGGGVDIRVWRFVGARFEVRDFYSGNPAFNTPVAAGGLHSVVAAGGVVLRFGPSGR